MSGHVHTTARVAEVAIEGENRRLTFELCDASWMRYVLPKGYVAVDGCSLTVGEVRLSGWGEGLGHRCKRAQMYSHQPPPPSPQVTDTGFCVYLIPETLRATVLGSKREGDSVNIEVEAQTQAIVDTVERVVERYMAARS